MISRREALIGAGVAALLLCCSEPPDPDVVHLVTRTDRDAAARLGRRWLDSQALRPDRASLLRSLCGAAPPRFADAAAARAFVRERHHADFVAARVVEVEGWVLSKTEVELYALVALVRV